VSGQARPRVSTGLAALAVVAAWLLPAMGAMAQPATPRLLVMDLPYAQVWEGAVRALGGPALVRASDGVIETARVERAPRPDEAEVERVAERVTVWVEAVAEKVTRVTVTVETEALSGGSWRAVDASPATVRTVLDRIRAGIG
jgi:hypothetical protein